MRKLLFLAAFLGILWIVDTYGFNGRYSSTLALQARDQAHLFSYQMQLIVERLTGS